MPSGRRPAIAGVAIHLQDTWQDRCVILHGRRSSWLGFGEATSMAGGPRARCSCCWVTLVSRRRLPPTDCRGISRRRRQTFVLVVFGQDPGRQAGALGRALRGGVHGHRADGEEARARHGATRG